MGLHYIEAIPGQKLSKDQPNVTFGEGLPADARKAVKKKLADSGVKLVNYGVCGLPKDIDQSRKMFEFAKDMGIETIVSEPPRTLSTPWKSCAKSTGSTWRSTTIRSPRTTGTPRRC